MSDSSSAEQKEELLQQLAQSGVKHSPDKIVAIRKDKTGRVVFLEVGNKRSGLQHIVDEHTNDFTKAGVLPDEIAPLVMEAVATGEQIGMQGTRPIFRVHFKEQIKFVAVQVGDNGYIVGANPASSRKYSAEEGAVGDESD